MTVQPLLPPKHRVLADISPAPTSRGGRGSGDIPSAPGDRASAADGHAAVTAVSDGEAASGTIAGVASPASHGGSSAGLKGTSFDLGLDRHGRGSGEGEGGHGGEGEGLDRELHFGSWCLFGTGVFLLEGAGLSGGLEVNTGLVVREEELVVSLGERGCLLYTIRSPIS